MQLSYRPFLALTVPWGQGAKSIPPVEYEKVSLSGRFITESKRMMRPVYAIRIDQDGNLYFLYETTQEKKSSMQKYRLMSFNNQGDSINQFDFIVNAQNVGTWRILDFSPDHQNGVYLLEFLETQDGTLTYRLRRLNQQGLELWVRSGSLNHKAVDFSHFEGKFEYLIVPDKNALYLPARYPQRGLAGFDVSTGKMLSVYDWDEPSDKLTMGPSGEIYYSRLLDDVSGKRHALIKRELIKGKREVIESEIQFLHDLAGVDADGAIYPRIHDGISRLSSTGQVEWKQHIHGLVVRADDEHVFICSRAEVVDNNVVLEVDHYDTSRTTKQTLIFQMPEKHLSDKGDFNLPRLVNVDTKSLFYFHAGETDYQGGTLFTFTVKGQLQSILSLNESDAGGQPVFDKVNQHLLPIETRVGSPSMFEVDQFGNVYIPLSDSKGFKVIRLQPGNGIY